MKALVIATSPVEPSTLIAAISLSEEPQEHSMSSTARTALLSLAAASALLLLGSTVPAAANSHDDNGAEVERVDECFDRAGVYQCHDYIEVSQENATPSGNTTSVLITNGQSTFESDSGTSTVRYNQSATQTRHDGELRSSYQGHERWETSEGTCQTMINYQQVDYEVKNRSNRSTC